MVCSGTARMRGKATGGGRVEARKERGAVVGQGLRQKAQRESMPKYDQSDSVKPWPSINVLSSCSSLRPDLEAQRNLSSVLTTSEAWEPSSAASAVPS